MICRHDPFFIESEGNENFLISSGMSQGGRSFMQDQKIVLSQKLQDGVSFVAVLDGHGHKEAAMFFKNEIEKSVGTIKIDQMNDFRFLQNWISDIEKDASIKMKDNCQKQGTTLVFSFIIPYNRKQAMIQNVVEPEIQVKKKFDLDNQKPTLSNETNKKFKIVTGYIGDSCARLKMKPEDDKNISFYNLTPNYHNVSNNKELKLVKERELKAGKSFIHHDVFDNSIRIGSTSGVSINLTRALGDFHPSLKNVKQPEMSPLLSSLDFTTVEASFGDTLYLFTDGFNHDLFHNIWKKKNFPEQELYSMLLEGTRKTFDNVAIVAVHFGINATNIREKHLYVVDKFEPSLHYDLFKDICHIVDEKKINDIAESVRIPIKHHLQEAIQHHSQEPVEPCCVIS